MKKEKKSEVWTHFLWKKDHNFSKTMTVFLDFEMDSSQRHVRLKQLFCKEEEVQKLMIM